MMPTGYASADLVSSTDSANQSDSQTVCRLVVTWQHPVERLIQPVGMLSFDGETYSFQYIRNALKVLDFRPFLGFPHLWARYEADTLFPIFAQRAMTPRRPDFARWVTRLGLNDDATPWEQIARSGGRRQGDKIQIFPVPVVVDGRMECDFLVHGIRHVLDHELRVGDALLKPPTRDEFEHRLMNLQVGEELHLHDEPSNMINPQAILATNGGDAPLGWVPDLLLDEIHRISHRSTVVATLRAVNGPEAGWHLRLLAHLRAEVPNDFEVFVGPRWEVLDPAECPHMSLTSRGLGALRDDEVRTVASDWSTCNDCGASLSQS